VTDSKQAQQRLAELTHEVERLRAQQVASNAILRSIAHAPANLSTILDTIAESAARLCETDDAVIRQIDGDRFTQVTHFGPIPTADALDSRLVVQGGFPSRAVLERRTIQIEDMLALSEVEYPAAREAQRFYGHRSLLVTPMLFEGEPVGLIMLQRLQVRPFTEEQIALLEAFADQAVIAIENARLFEQLDSRNRDLAESLEQQTATSEVLRIIAGSPSDLQTVLDTVASNAMRLCEAGDAIILTTSGDHLTTVAHVGSIPWPHSLRPLALERTYGKAILERRSIQVDDIVALPPLSNPENEDRGRAGGIRTVLATPLLKDDEAIGAIFIRRTEVRPFSERQIGLLETFADQAVIAIENARLFEELDARNRDLTESLEQQTATSGVLRVIASSPADLRAVLEIVAENAARFCDAADVVIRRVDGDELPMAAHYGPIVSAASLPLSRGVLMGRAVLDRTTLQTPDILSLPDADYPDRRDQSDFRALLATPLVRDGEPIGVIGLRRVQAEAFSDKQVALLESFCRSGGYCH
jgi:GAF domain-containing protein